MYKIELYHDKDGYSQIEEFLTVLSEKHGKDAKINRQKVNDCIQALALYGTYIGKPVCKHLDGDIWELRPLKNRFLFAALNNNGFVLLHQFRKKTQKTPKREIVRAKKEYKDYLERSK